MITKLELRPINHHDDRQLYRDRYPIAEIDRQLINALSNDSAGAFWRDVIARRWKPLPRFLPANHWSNQVLLYGPNWLSQWETPVEPDPVITFLRTSLTWTDDKLGFVVMNGGRIYTTRWGLFLRYWSAFLSLYDEAIIISPKDSGVVRFSETGVLFTGQREATSPMDRDSVFAEKLPVENE